MRKVERGQRTRERLEGDRELENGWKGTKTQKKVERDKELEKG